MTQQNAETFEYRGLTIFVWRTDDPMEVPSDDPDDEGPYEIGDFYCGVAEWGLRTSASVTTAAKAEKLARKAVDTVTGVGMAPAEALRLGDAAAIPFMSRTQ